MQIFIFVLFLIILLTYFVMVFKDRYEHIIDLTSNPLSNEAIQNIAKLYADTTSTATFNNLNATGNISATNSQITNLATPNISSGSNNPITVSSPILFNTPNKPFVMTVAIGDAKVPITDLNGNTFSSNKWTCKQISGSCFIGIKNGVWWISNNFWGSWQVSSLEFIPVAASDYYSSYVYHGTFVNDAYSFPSGWSIPPKNADLTSYRVFKNDGTLVNIVPTGITG